MATNLDFAVVANNDISVYFNVVDANEKPVDITNFLIKWQVRAGNEILITKSSSQIAIINPTQGIFGVPIAASDTANIPQNYYIHEAVTVDGSGKAVTLTNNDSTLTYGQIFIRQQYTAQ